MEGVPEHSHCKVCGKVIPPGREFCSAEHELEYLRGRKQVERIQRVFSFLMAAVASLFVINLIVRYLLG